MTAHEWKGRIYLQSGKVQTVCTNCAADRGAQNRDRACRSPVPGETIWNMLTAGEKIAAAIRAAGEE